MFMRINSIKKTILKEETNAIKEKTERKKIHRNRRKTRTKKTSRRDAEITFRSQKPSITIRES